MIIKEKIKHVDKSWGEEIWFVNDKYYCLKALAFDPEESTTMHHHPRKRETLVCWAGYGTIETSGGTYTLVPGSRPKTIEPGTWHRIRAITDMVLLEVSTTHSDDDVERLKDV